MTLSHGPQFPHLYNKSVEPEFLLAQRVHESILPCTQLHFLGMWNPEACQPRLQRVHTGKPEGLMAGQMDDRNKRTGR